MVSSSTICSIIIAVALIVTFAFYPSLPEEIATHWGLDGEPDDSMHKFWGVVIIPTIMVVLAILIPLFIRLDPMQKNIRKFRKEADFTVYSILLFLLYIQVLILVWNFSPLLRFNMIKPFVVGTSLLLFSLAFVLGKSRRNYTIGIRTPWSLSSDKVWDETHKMGSILFNRLAIVNLLGFVIPQYAFWIFLIGLAVTIVFSIWYSYFIYKKMGKKA